MLKNVWSTSQISRELKLQILKEFGSIPKANYITKLWRILVMDLSEFMDYEKAGELIGVEVVPMSENMLLR